MEHGERRLAAGRSSGQHKNRRQRTEDRGSLGTKHPVPCTLTTGYLVLLSRLTWILAGFDLVGLETTGH